MSNSNGIILSQVQRGSGVNTSGHWPLASEVQSAAAILRTPLVVHGWLLAIGLTLLAGCGSPPRRGPAQPVAAPQEASPAQAALPAAATAPLTVPDLVKQAAAKPSEPFEGDGWQDMFDGQTLAGWTETPFAGRGEVQCEAGLLVLKMGDPFTGINWTRQFPKVNYEVALDAMRLNGSDFFCGLTVPVGDSFCSLIVGGWGGSLVGISSLEGLDASENETTKYRNFESRRWYRVRLRVTEKRIQAWIDGEKLVDADTTDKKISLRPGDIELSKPFGLACWQTSTALRESSGST